MGKKKQRDWHFQFGGIVVAETEQEAEERALHYMLEEPGEFLELIEPVEEEQKRERGQATRQEMLGLLREVLVVTDGSGWAVVPKIKGFIARLDNPKPKEG